MGDFSIIGFQQLNSCKTMDVIIRIACFEGILLTCIFVILSLTVLHNPL